VELYLCSPAMLSWCGQEQLNHLCVLIVPRLNILNLNGRTRLTGNHDLDGQAFVRVEPNAGSHMRIAGPKAVLTCLA